ncbi:MAG TPA: response regulator [Candidatus Sulfotelmatobacter sp.]|nr:response regulator [Candidatus Sulfotelmatobacter sp.]
MARKILLADDSVTAQNMGRKILADAGYEVITVNNGSAALKKIAEHKPDLIVLDVYMPGYSGLEVCQRLKEVKETARIPVLLTVGKLEPFKPEECKRVKAEGYIVKPFEASELLSALSKLEDRVVPRSEPSKPGRFARAIAAVEEGRTDETTGANDSDDGWKNRIGFPSKKKKKQEEDNSDTYNPGNRDLRTTVERPAPQPIAARDENTLDVAALAAKAGLPTDVTPEELAALAAAAAQVQAAVDGREAAAAGEKIEARAEATEAKAEAGDAKIESKSENKSETKTETKTESKHEAKLESQPEAQPVPQAATAEVADEIPAGATFAVQTGEKTIEALAGAGKNWKEAEPSLPVRDFDVIAASAARPDDNASLQGEVASGNGTGHLQEIEKKEAEEQGGAAEESAAPATMAASATASAAYTAVGSTTHRWTAVPVAVVAEEAAVSLELEMQKAYAAFAAAEANQPGFVRSMVERATTAVENSISSPAASVPGAAEPSANLAPDEDEIARTLRDVAHASAEAVDSALAKLESVAEAQVQQSSAAAATEEASSKPTQPEAASQENPKWPESPAQQAIESVPTFDSAAPVTEKLAEALVVELKADASASGQDAVAEVVQPRDQEKDQDKTAWESVATPVAETPIAEAPTTEMRTDPIGAEARVFEGKASEAQVTEAEVTEKKKETDEVAAAPAVAEAQLPEPERGVATSAEPVSESSGSESSRSESSNSGTSSSESSNSESSNSETSHAEPWSTASSVSAVAQEASNLSASSVTSTQEPSVSAEQVAEASGGPALRRGKLAGGDMAENKESELAATTAAAWASWRQIRESGDNKTATGSAKSRQQDDDDDEYPAPTPDAAAMAVAAGAEKAPEGAPEGSSDDPAAIASIVDKVLADLRPKIAEEISKKLKKK